MDKKKVLFHIQQYLRLSQHHGQGSLLDFRWPIEAHAIHTLEKLRLAAQDQK